MPSEREGVYVMLRFLVDLKTFSNVLNEEKCEKCICIQISLALKPRCAYYKLSVEKGMELKGEQR